MPKQQRSGAELLREWMTKEGLSQPKAAMLLGTTQTNVSKLLLRQVVTPTLPLALTLRDIAKIPLEAWGP